MHWGPTWLKFSHGTDDQSCEWRSVNVLTEVFHCPTGVLRAACRLIARMRKSRCRCGPRSSSSMARPARWRCDARPPLAATASLHLGIERSCSELVLSGLLPPCCLQRRRRAARGRRVTCSGGKRQAGRIQQVGQLADLSACIDGSRVDGCDLSRRCGSDDRNHQRSGQEIFTQLLERPTGGGMHHLWGHVFSRCQNKFSDSHPRVGHG